jgi:hypothetical protein
MAPDAKKLGPLFLSLFNAPVDDEPLTDEDKKALDEAEEDIRHNKVMSLDKLAQDLGIILGDRP